MDIVVLIIKIILTSTFTIFGVAKLINIPNISEMQKETFTNFGLNKNLMMLTGAGELLGVAFLWLPIFDDHAKLGGALLAIIALLAAGFHIKFKDKPADLMPAIIMGILSIIIAIFA